MTSPAPGPDPLSARLKHFIVDSLRLRDFTADQITDDEPLIGGRLGLDSLDALSLGMNLEEEFGITIHNQGESRSAFASVASLAAFIRVQESEHARLPAAQPARTVAA